MVAQNKGTLKPATSAWSCCKRCDVYLRGRRETRTSIKQLQHTESVRRSVIRSGVLVLVVRAYHCQPIYSFLRMWIQNHWTYGHISEIMSLKIFESIFVSSILFNDTRFVPTTLRMRLVRFIHANKLNMLLSLLTPLEFIEGAWKTHQIQFVAENGKLYLVDKDKRYVNCTSVVKRSPVLT